MPALQFAIQTEIDGKEFYTEKERMTYDYYHRDKRDATPKMTPIYIY